MSLNSDVYLYETITGDNVLNGYINGRLYVDVAPEDAQYPFVVMMRVKSTPVTSMTADDVMDSELWQLAIWDNSLSYNTIESIADRIRMVLHKSNGPGVIGAIYQGSTRLNEQEGENAYKAVVLEFRLYTQ